MPYRRNAAPYEFQQSRRSRRTPIFTHSARLAFRSAWRSLDPRRLRRRPQSVCAVTAKIGNIRRASNVTLDDAVPKWIVVTFADDFLRRHRYSRVTKWAKWKTPGTQPVAVTRPRLWIS